MPTVSSQARLRVPALPYERLSALLPARASTAGTPGIDAPASRHPSRPTKKWACAHWLLRPVWKQPSIISRGQKRKKSRPAPAISEQLSLLEKETGIEEGFFIQPLGAARGSIFRRRSFVEVVRPGESFDDGEFGCAKGGLLAFSVGRQLLSAAQRRERLSHKSSSNWALSCTRCLPRWRYRSR